MAKEKLPSFLQSALWSYDLSKFDPQNEADKRIIVTQILNHGTWQQLQWLLKVYREGDLKQVLLIPQRGLWYQDALDYWQTVLNVSVPKRIYQRALFHLAPQPDALGNP